jgi:hypothetical protein
MSFLRDVGNKDGGSTEMSRPGGQNTDVSRGANHWRDKLPQGESNEGLGW